MDSRIFLLALCVISATCNLVQVVTPERVEVITPESTDDGSHKKREILKNSTMDSYLEALKESQSQTAASRFDPSPEHSYEEPQQSYGPPSPSYESYHQDNNYGPPQGYQPSKPTYHTVQPPSKPVIPYGPPSPITYLPPASPQPTPFYGVPFAAPHSMVMSILQGLLPKGIDLETFFKLLLKLTLFKMIVKFLAVFCLLLAYPLFQSKEKEEMMEEDEDRQFEAINDLTALVWESIYPQRYVNNTAEAEENDGEPDEDEGLVEKVAGEIDEKMTLPSEEAAIAFLEFCVAAANTVVGWMMSFVRRRNNEMDPIEQLLWSFWEKLKEMTRLPS